MPHFHDWWSLRAPIPQPKHLWTTSASTIGSFHFDPKLSIMVNQGRPTGAPQIVDKGLARIEEAEENPNLALELAHRR